MRKLLARLFCGVLAVGIIGFSGCSSNTTNAIEDRYEKVSFLSMDYRFWTDDPTKLPDVSDLIVLFKPETMENETEHFPDGLVSVGFTLTTGTVVKVLQGTKPEEGLVVMEPCYTTDGGSVLWTIDGYLPMQSGKEYLLFLKAYDEDSEYAGMYYPINMIYGKYVPSAKSEKEFEVASRGRVEVYSQWRDAVANMYPEVFD